MIQVTAMDESERATVSHRLSPMTSATGRFASSDCPKFPCTTCVIQLKYCTYTGWSSP